ncbi:interleukin-17F-like, partial [Scyliorhinus canicula]|uniref:interleukin-17F-like n=1 Tax=Scyliorhinus canicula TaxID=7830 RepID=UPI0018F3D6D7
PSLKDISVKQVSAVLFIVLLAALAETISAAKGRYSKSKTGHPRLRRTTKYVLEPENIKLLFPPVPHHWRTLNGAFNNRSLSPWIYKVDFDSNRYPETILKAECVSSHCPTCKGLQNANLNTRLVRQEMIVLKRIKETDRKVTFQAEKMMVPVACVCVHPNYVSV